MHNAVFNCLVARGEALYSVFLSYRSASEAPLAQLVFDELNHRFSPNCLMYCAALSMLTADCSVTSHGHRVTVYWDPRRAVKSEEWDEGIIAGLFSSLCFFPILSYGSTAPLAAIPRDHTTVPECTWVPEPLGLRRIKGVESDREDCVLKVQLFS